MKKYILSLLTAAALSFSTPAMAGGDFEEDAPPPESWYFEIQGGAWLGEEPNISIQGLGSSNYDPDNVFTVMGAVGRSFAPGWRGELNFAVTSGGDGNVFGFRHNGNFTTFTIIGNAIYDFDIGGPITPFVGLGAGVGITDVDNLGAVGGAFTTNDTDAAFIANGLVGFNVPITENIAFTARYTFGWMDSMTFANTGGNPSSRQADQFIHAATGGIRINLR